MLARCLSTVRFDMNSLSAISTVETLAYSDSISICGPTAGRFGYCLLPLLCGLAAVGTGTERIDCESDSSSEALK